MPRTRPRVTSLFSFNSLRPLPFSPKRPVSNIEHQAPFSMESLQDLFEATSPNQKTAYPFWPNTQTIPMQIHYILTRPQSCKAAYVFNIVFLVFVALSISLLAAESVISNNLPWTMHVRILFIVECISSSFFTVEYMLRIVTWPSHRYRALVRNFATWTDLLAILPFWIDLVVTTYFASMRIYTTAWQILQLGRVLRLLKFAESSKRIHMAFLALRKSRDGIFMLLFIFALSISVFSSLMYYIESLHCTRDANGELTYTSPLEVAGTRAAFQSIPEAMWWCIVTITTTGYGDVVPRTASGKVVAGLAMVCAVMMFSFPITIFSQSLSDVYQEHRQRKALLKQFRKTLQTPASGSIADTSHGTLRSASERLAHMHITSLQQHQQLMDECLDRTDRELDTLRTQLDDLRGLVKQMRKLSAQQSAFSQRMDVVHRSRPMTET